MPKTKEKISTYYFGSPRAAVKVIPIDEFILRIKDSIKKGSVPRLRSILQEKFIYPEILHRKEIFGRFKENEKLVKGVVRVDETHYTRSLSEALSTDYREYLPIIVEELMKANNPGLNQAFEDALGLKKNATEDQLDFLVSRIVNAINNDAPKVLESYLKTNFVKTEKVTLLSKMKKLVGADKNQQPTSLAKALLADYPQHLQKIVSALVAADNLRLYSAFNQTMNNSDIFKWTQKDQLDVSREMDKLQEYHEKSGEADSASRREGGRAYEMKKLVAILNDELNSDRNPLKVTDNKNIFEKEQPNSLKRQFQNLHFKLGLKVILHTGKGKDRENKEVSVDMPKLLKDSGFKKCISRISLLLKLGNQLIAKFSQYKEKAKSLSDAPQTDSVKASPP